MRFHVALRRRSERSFPACFAEAAVAAPALVSELRPVRMAPIGRLHALSPVAAAYWLAALPGLLLLGVYAVDYIGRAWSVVTFPYGWDYGESPELGRAVAAAHLMPVYMSWAGPPFHMANYTPLFSLLNAVCVRFAGVQYQSGRALAWGCSLLFCAGLAWLAWREGRTLLAPVVAVLLWFSSHYVWDWTPLGREDELAMLCSLIGLILVYEGQVRGRPVAGLPAARKSADRAVWLALPWFLAAIYARQTTIEAMAACGAYLLCTRPRLGLRFVLIFALLAGGTFVALDLVTHGAFVLNTVTGNQNVFSWAKVRQQGADFWSHYQAAALLALVYVALQIGRRRQQLFVLWLVATFAVGVTIGKDGAAENYGLLPWGAASLAAGLGVAELCRISTAWWRRRWLRPLGRPVALLLAAPVGFLLLLHAALAFHLPYHGAWSQRTLAEVSGQGGNRLILQWLDTGWYRRALPAEPAPAQIERRVGIDFKPSAGPQKLDEQAQIDRLVAATPGDVLDEDMTHLLLAGKRIYIQPFEFSEEALLQHWDQAPVVAAIAQQHFALVILTRPLSPRLQTQRFTPQMVAALTTNYCPAGRTTGYFLYRPCPR